MAFAAFYEEPSFLVDWFELLEVYCSKNNLFFTHFVPLKKVPLQIEEKEILTLINQIHQEFFIYSTIKDSKTCYTYYSRPFFSIIYFGTLTILSL